MSQIHPEIVLDPSQLPAADVKRPLPKPLADFKTYVDSKCCFHSAPMEGAQLVQVYPKVAYKCQMKTLLEVRSEHWKEEPATWNHETRLASTTLGRWLEDTRRGGAPVGNIWNDYHFELPAGDEKSSKEQALPQCSYQSRCVQCRGKGLTSCSSSECGGSGWVRCTRCNGRGRTETSTQIIICGCRDGKMPCSKCKGGGKVHCPKCKGYGGFFHSVRLRAEWHTRISTWYCQNSFLPEKQIDKAKRTLFWSNTRQPWSKEAAFDGFVSVLQQDEAQENVSLRNTLKNEYEEKHLKPVLQAHNRLRRVACTIERLDFEEVHYTLDDMYVNKKDSALGKRRV